MRFFYFILIPLINSFIKLNGEEISIYNYILKEYTPQPADDPSRQSDGPNKRKIAVFKNFFICI